MKIENITLGCDPEMFLFDGLEYVSAYGLIPGTKEHPFPVEKGAVQVDGVALEFNIDPASDPDTFSNNISVVLAQLGEMVKKVNPEFKMVFTPVAKFDPTYFSILPHECKILGCDPDYNILGDLRFPDEDLQNIPVRTAAGHMHLGFDKGQDPMNPVHFERCRRIAAEFARVKGFYPETKEERERIKYYGQPGTFRPKSYGVELRGSSNLWVEHEKDRKDMFVRTYDRLNSMAASL